MVVQGVSEPSLAPLYLAACGGFCCCGFTQAIFCTHVNLQRPQDPRPAAQVHVNWQNASPFLCQICNLAALGLAKNYWPLFTSYKSLGTGSIKLEILCFQRSHLCRQVVKSGICPRWWRSKLRCFRKPSEHYQGWVASVLCCSKSLWSSPTPERAWILLRETESLIWMWTRQDVQKQREVWGVMDPGLWWRTEGALGGRWGFFSLLERDELQFVLRDNKIQGKGFSPGPQHHWDRISWMGRIDFHVYFPGCEIERLILIHLQKVLWKR